MRDNIRSRLANIVRMSKTASPQAEPERQNWYLKGWREFRGLTQEELAHRVGSSKGYVSQLESKERRYNQDLLERFAKALDCEPWQLLIDPSSIARPLDPGVEMLTDAVRRLPEDQRPVALRAIEAMAKPAK